MTDYRDRVPMPPGFRELVHWHTANHAGTRQDGAQAGPGRAQGASQVRSPQDAASGPQEGAQRPTATTAQHDRAGSTITPPTHPQ